MLISALQRPASTFSLHALCSLPTPAKTPEGFCDTPLPPESGDASSTGYVSGPEEALLRMCAHFGWPAAWHPLLGQLVAARPIPWASWQGLLQTNMLQCAVQIGECGSHGIPCGCHA